MPTATQYEVVKQQCKSFEALGYPTQFVMQGLKEGAAPAVKIDAYFKRWHFSDPDWDVVSKQLNMLYMHLTKRKKC